MWQSIAATYNLLQVIFNSNLRCSMFYDICYPFKPGARWLHSGELSVRKENGNKGEWTELKLNEENAR